MELVSLDNSYYKLTKTASQNDEIRIGSHFSEIFVTRYSTQNSMKLVSLDNSYYILTKIASQNDEIRVGSNFSETVATRYPKYHGSGFT